MPTRTFDGVYASLAEIAEFVRFSIKDSTLTATDQFSLETAVDEAVSNIIEHAYQGEHKGTIRCQVTINNACAKIILEDHGSPFDPSCIPPPTLHGKLKNRQNHGLGYYMMCQLVDDVTFDFNEKRNRLTLEKKFKKSV
jgi:serine/threonine-protein kinase RsbW